MSRRIEAATLNERVFDWLGRGGDRDWSEETAFVYLTDSDDGCQWLITFTEATVGEARERIYDWWQNPDMPEFTERVYHQFREQIQQGYEKLLT